MLIAQLTDLHVGPRGRLLHGIVDTEALLARAVDALLVFRPRPDLVLVSGDLVDAGLDEEYRLVRDQLDRLPMPVYAVPGNHDRREGFRAAFADRPWARAHPRFIQYALEAAPLRILALDTLVPGEVHGELCPDRLDWLERELAAAPDRPTILMMHHPPFVCGIEHMDAINCRNAAALGAIAQRHRQIERIVCGHHHRPIQVRWNGTLVSVAPSVAHQVSLDLLPDADARFVLEPPAFHLHAWIPGTGLVTHQAYVDAYPGPYPFAADDEAVA